MRASSVLGCSLVLTGAMFGCSSSSGSGGAGGAGTTAATTATSTHVTTSSTHAASTTGSPAAGTGGAGGGGDFITCNPVNDTQCDVPGGDDCDYADPTGFVCYLGPSSLALCATCMVGDANSPYCKDGTTCAPIDAAGNNGMCTKFCCSDMDCGGAAGSCTQALFNFLGGDHLVGLCGVPDASGTFLTPTCGATVPLTSPSMGMCYTPPAN